MVNDEDKFAENSEKQQKYDDCMRIWLGNEEKEEKRLRKSDDDGKNSDKKERVKRLK